MNRDEGQLHLSHIYDELLLNENLPNRKSTSNSKTSTKSSYLQDELIVIQVLIKETVVSETSTTLKWVVYCLDQRIWNIFTDIYLPILMNLFNYIM